MSSGRQTLPGNEPLPFEREEHERPWAVFVHNDDVTPMDFVVHILITVFELPAPNAAVVTYTAHINGKAYVQTPPRNEAHRRVGQARFTARLRQFPLEFSMEAE